MITKVAIMQPYFFPYLGYFQLIAASDLFVLYDDTQLISRGWVNRNRILVNGEPSFITLPLRKSRLRDNINCRHFVDDIAWHKRKVLKAIHLSYSRAPFFSEVFPLVQSILACTESNLAAFNEFLIRRTCEHLGISAEILVSSRLGIGSELSSQDRVIAIAKGLGADVAVNPIGGLDLYSCEEFRRRDIVLKFIRMDPMAYRQFGTGFVENLSVIDVLMFCPLSEVREMLFRYSLIDNCQ